MLAAMKLYFRLIEVSFKGQMQYKASFIMMSLGYFIVTFIEFLGVWALLDRFGTLKGWTLAEVAFFYGIINTAFAVAEAGGRGFNILHRYVRSGEFDRILLRPRSITLQILGQEFQLMRLGRFSQGVIILLWAAAALSIKWTVFKVLLAVLAVIGGAFLFMGIFVLQATLSFWTVESLEIVNTLTYGGVAALQFPLAIYRDWFRKFFIFIVPLACTNYFPAMGILPRVDPLNSPVWSSWISPMTGVIFFFITLRVWRIGLRHYRSTGS